MLFEFVDQFQVLQRKLTHASDENEEGELLYCLCRLRLLISDCAQANRKSGSVPDAEVLERLAYEIWHFEEVARQGPLQPERAHTKWMPLIGSRIYLARLNGDKTSISASS